jgi:nitrogen fixation NifU-like protein
MDIYRERLLDHYHNPRNFGELENNNISTELENASCGDIIQIQLKVEEGIVKDAKFNSEGCAVSIASASILTEYIIGKSLEEVEKLDFDHFLEIIGIELTLSRMKCANLSLEATKTAIKKLTEKKN